MESDLAPSDIRGRSPSPRNGNGIRDGSRSRDRSPRPISPRGSPARGRSPPRDRSPSNLSPKRERFGEARTENGEYRNRLANTASPSRVLGVFGLSPSTTDKDLKNEFSRFGKIDHVDLIMDRKTGRSKCFGFVYFDLKDDASRAKDETQGLELHGKQIRTDFSATKKPHDPTPGKYYGNPRYDSRRSPPRYSPYGRDNYRGGDRYREDRYRDERGGDRYREDRYRDDRGGDRYREDRYRDDRGGDRYRDDRYREDRMRDDRDRYRDDDRRYR
ncbi:hypothetical protein CYY_007546 [Polysphondylium violaceum]|uniref:RRM domain-containing protein n=1 Tax=Polysphondylium violaceum TaxID=133409 RepID=A0A8J4PNE9_9MYCE|nr:hypothetical protein CYY_007546 [Polysphondylium violaceum]